MPNSTTSLHFLIAAGALWVALIAGLHVFPLLYPPDPSLPNAAAMLGYNIEAAYLVFAGIAGFGGLAFAYYGPNMPRMAAPPADKKSPALLLWTERVGLLSVVALVYWPPALARFGPHIEADYFISILWRVACGQTAYTDFEFQYGPLMIGLADAWIALTGFSLQAYYTFYMLLQVVFFGVLLLVLQAHIRTQWKRYAALLILLPFFFDPLVGLNSMPWRYFLVPLMILAIAAHPQSRAWAMLAGCMIGAQAALFAEYGVVALVVALSLYGVQLFYPGRRGAMTGGLIAGTTGMIVWAALAWIVTGASLPAYLGSLVEAAANTHEFGIGQIAFHWTVHSLALAAVLCCGLVLSSGSLRYIGFRPLTVGDFHLIGALVFAIIALRIAFQRADYLHMIVPFIPLILVLLLNQPRNLLGSVPTIRQTALAAILAAAIAHTAGQSLVGKGMLLSQMGGIAQELSEEPALGDLPAKQLGTLDESVMARPEFGALAALLATPNLTNRPVLFYGNSQRWAASIGVCPTNDRYHQRPPTDNNAPSWRTQAENAALLVVIPNIAYKQMLAGEPAKASLLQFADRRKRLSWLTSPHYSQRAYEDIAESKLSRNSLGIDLLEEFHPLAVTDRFTVLERKALGN